MPRKSVSIQPGNSYHISARTVNGDWFSLPLEEIWTIMENQLYLLAHGFEVRIHAFVLMSNHYHLLATPEANNFSEGMRYFMRETSRETTRLSARINQTYGARNHKTHILGLHHFMNAYKYIYRNPVRAGICNLVEQYPYSTLHGLCGLRKIVTPIEDQLLFQPQFDQSILEWLNTKSTPEHEAEIRHALKRSEFELKTPKKTGRRSELEEVLI